MFPFLSEPPGYPAAVLGGPGSDPGTPGTPVLQEDADDVKSKVGGSRVENRHRAPSLPAHCGLGEVWADRDVGTDAGAGAGAGGNGGRETKEASRPQARRQRPRPRTVTSARQVPEHCRARRRLARDAHRTAPSGQRPGVHQEQTEAASPGAQGRRIHLPGCETRVRSLAREDFTCCRGTCSTLTPHDH